MCLYGACKLMNSPINNINHAEIIYIMIFNKKKDAFDLPTMDVTFPVLVSR